MVQHRNSCFVIADGGHVRFVFPAEDNALHTRDASDSPHLHDQSSDLGTDRPGRSFESGSVTRHAIAPKNDPHEMEKQKFAHTVAKKVCDLSAENGFSELILVAPSHILSEIRDHLDVITAKKLVGTLAKDLTKVPDDALYPHLKEWVRPTNRAV
jgi:protein required for attachment to host cells